jgi:hypothetical protein
MGIVLTRPDLTSYHNSSSFSARREKTTQVGLECLAVSEKKGMSDFTRAVSPRCSHVKWGHGRANGGQTTPSWLAAAHAGDIDGRMAL